MPYVNGLMMYTKRAHDMRPTRIFLPRSIDITTLTDGNHFTVKKLSVNSADGVKYYLLYERYDNILCSQNTYNVNKITIRNLHKRLSCTYSKRIYIVTTDSDFIPRQMTSAEIEWIRPKKITEY